MTCAATGNWIISFFLDIVSPRIIFLTVDYWSIHASKACKDWRNKKCVVIVQETKGQFRFYERNILALAATAAWTAVTTWAWCTVRTAKAVTPATVTNTPSPTVNPSYMHHFRSISPLFCISTLFAARLSCRQKFFCDSKTLVQVRHKLQPLGKQILVALPPIRFCEILPFWWPG